MSSRDDLPLGRKPTLIGVIAHPVLRQSRSSEFQSVNLVSASLLEMTSYAVLVSVQPTANPKSFAALLRSSPLEEWNLVYALRAFCSSLIDRFPITAGSVTDVAVSGLTIPCGPSYNLFTASYLRKSYPRLGALDQTDDHIPTN